MTTSFLLNELKALASCVCKNLVSLEHDKVILKQYEGLILDVTLPIVVFLFIFQLFFKTIYLQSADGN